MYGNFGNKARIPRPKHKESLMSGKFYNSAVASEFPRWYSYPSRTEAHAAHSGHVHKNEGHPKIRTGFCGCPSKSMRFFREAPMNERKRGTKSAAAIAVAIPLAAGGLSALISSDAMRQYASMPKPPLSPPPWVFPLAWTILYALMGAASFLIYASSEKKKEGARKKALALYALQLFLNFIWSPLFFNGGMARLSLAVLILLWMSVAALIFFAGKTGKAPAALLIPYLAWLTFAGYLNAAVAIAQ